MLKALMKKQFMELNRQIFVNTKTGKPRSKGGRIGFALLLLLIFIAVAFAFFGLAMSLSSLLENQGSVWLYYALMGIMAILLGTFGSVFNTYASLYQAKDNEFLLSMPIRPGMILTARMAGVLGMSLFYSAMVWLPTMIVAWIHRTPSVGEVIFPLILTIAVALVVTVLTCVLGWVVALIASRLKNKSSLTVIISLLFFAVYYYFCFQANSLITALLANLTRIETVIRSWFWPVYQLGSGAAGNVSSMLIFTGITLAAFAVCWIVLERSFVSIITTKRGGKEAIYRERRMTCRSESAALLWRELKHFTSSPTYMLNTGFGLVIMVFLSIFALIKLPDVPAMLVLVRTSMPWLTDVLPVGLTAITCLIISTNETATPAVSLEGKNIWLIQSLPSSTKKILMAKLHMHVLLNIIPALICTITIGCVFRMGAATILCMMVPVVAYIWFIGLLGLTLDLLRPNLHWTNESVPIKQSLNVLFVMLGGWILCAGFAVLYYFLRSALSPMIYLIILGSVIVLLDLLLYRWICRGGVKRFDLLG